MSGKSNAWCLHRLVGHHPIEGGRPYRLRSPMPNIFLAAFLIVFGLNVLFDISLPGWVIGVLALIAGLLLLGQRFGFNGKKS